MQNYFIKEMVRRGALAFSEAAGDEMAEEETDYQALADEQEQNGQAPAEETEEEMEEMDLDAEDPFNDPSFETEEETEDLDAFGDMEELEPEEPKEEEETVERIQTVDVVSQVNIKFDQYMQDAQIDWDAFVLNGRITKGPNFKYLEDLHTLLNKTFDEKKFRYVEIFNDYYDLLQDKNYAKSLNIYGRENFGKPYIAEGMALLVYELAVDWACVVVRFFKDNPQFDKDTTPEEDSWFKKFPNLEFLSYLAKLLIESKEFKKLITSQKAQDLLKDDTKYNLSDAQASKKPHMVNLGESLSYYAGIVNNDFGDITVGALDKLATVAFLSAKTQMPITERLAIIDRLIKIVSTKIPVGTTATGQDPTMTSLAIVDQTCTDLMKNRAEAKITLESNERNYPLFIENKN